MADAAFLSALAYCVSYRSEKLRAKLLQAQRDYFGAHTYERVDKPGVFRSDWTWSRREPDLGSASIVSLSNNDLVRSWHVDTSSAAGFRVWHLQGW